MKLKEVDRTGNVAWSPAAHHPIQLAVGTAAQQLDATFSTSATLELYNLNLGDPSLEIEATGSLTTDSRFFKLIWSPAGQLFGGAEQGQIFIWDAEKIQNKSSDPLVHNLRKHTGPVAALDLNPFQNNLVASGAGDSEIFIWDLGNVDKPMTPGAKAQPIHDVSCVAWNRQVQHILGSSHGGSCVVWDLRKNEPIIKIRDSMSRIKANTLCWHPDIATQLCIASEDDHTPVIQLWDLRAASSPLRTLEYHQRGILSMSWCPNDADLLLSCGKDNRILCWNPNSEQPAGEVVYELSTDSGQWSFDVQWCPRNPAVISSCSFDGHISVYSLMGGGRTAQTSSKVTDAFDVGGGQSASLPQQRQHLTSGDASSVIQEPMLSRAPKWLRRPVGATFGFGGKLVCFESNKSSAQAGGGTGSIHQMAPAVTISRVVTATDLVSRSMALEGAMQQGAYAEFCDKKIGGGGGSVLMDQDVDHNVWQFLKVNFEENPRLRYLELLGYDSTHTGQQVIDTLGARSQKKSNQPEKRKTATPQLLTGDEGDADLSQTTNGLATLDAFGKSDSSSDFDSIATAAATVEQESVHFDDSPINITVADDYEGLVTKALLTANFEAAVEAALHFDHLAEAVILASAGGQELLEKTQKRVLCFNNGQHSSLNKLISAVVTRDLESIVRTCEISNWRESLTTILTYADGEEFTSLCNMLGARLESEDRKLSVFAQLCYIVAGNMDKLVNIWCSSLPQQASQDLLQNLIEKVMILRKSVEMYQGQSDLNNDEMNSRLTEYAQLLAAQGCATTAYTYLTNSNNNHLPIALLRDRLYHSLHPSMFGPVCVAAPPRPFTIMDVKPDLQQQWQPQQQQQQTRVQQIQQQQQPQQQRRMSGAQLPHQRIEDQRRQRTDSGSYYQGTSQPQVQQQPLYPIHSSQSNVNQAPGVQGGGAAVRSSGYLAGSNNPYQPVQHYNEPAAPKSSHGSLSRYNQPVQQPVQPVNTYDPNSYQPVAPGPSHSAPAAAAGATYLASNMQPTHYTPGGPAVPATNLPRASTAWNDPPAVPSDSRKTRPVGGDHAPGAPSWDGLQLYNPLEHQQQQQPHHQQHQYQQQQWGPSGGQMMGGPGSSGMGVGLPPPQQQQVIEEPKKIVQPIPPEHLILQQILDRLVQLCISTTTNQQVKKKLDDVHKKLDLLYDRLRTNSLSPSTLTSLHQIVQSIQQYDYATSLLCHAELVRVGSFSETSAFMPAVKILLQTAQQLQAYIQ